MITEFTKQNFRTLSDDINAALAAVGAKHGITLRTGNGSIRGAELNLKLKATINGAPVQTRDDKYALAFKLHCYSYGFTLEDLGRSFVSNGKSFSISGLNTRGRDYPILAKSTDGKTYKFNDARIKGLLSSKAA